MISAWVYRVSNIQSGDNLSVTISASVWIFSDNPSDPTGNTDFSVTIHQGDTSNDFHTTLVNAAIEIAANNGLTLHKQNVLTVGYEGSL